MTQAPSKDKLAPGVKGAPGISTDRRRWLLAVVATGALAGGATLAWRRLSPAGSHLEQADKLWRQAFETPVGTSFDMSSLRGKPLVVNFWATWCPPCIEELPMLDAFYREQRSHGWQVIGLAVDQPAAVRKFLERTSVSFPIAMAGLAGTSLSRDLGNQAGGLPFTLVLDAAGRIRERKLGQLGTDDLRRWVKS